jgi:S1-C subfamily serine protease
VGLGPSADLDDLLLDSYSRTVSSVAEQLLPSVAALRVEDHLHRAKGAGSAVIISADGLLVTSAHVVHGSARGRLRSPQAMRRLSRSWELTG